MFTIDQWGFGVRELVERIAKTQRMVGFVVFKPIYDAFFGGQPVDKVVIGFVVLHTIFAAFARFLQVDFVMDQVICLQQFAEYFFGGQLLKDPTIAVQLRAIQCGCDADMVILMVFGDLPAAIL